MFLFFFSLTLLYVIRRPGPGGEGGAYDRKVGTEGRVGYAAKRAPHAVVATYAGGDAGGSERQGGPVIPMLPLRRASSTAHHAKHARSPTPGKRVRIGYQNSGCDALEHTYIRKDDSTVQYSTVQYSTVQYSRVEQYRARATVGGVHQVQFSSVQLRILT